MTERKKAAMTPFQRSLNSSGGAFGKYRRLAADSMGFLDFCLFEAFNILFSNTYGALGLAARQLVLRYFFARCERGSAFGRGLTIRNPSRIELERGVIVDDYAVLDARGAQESQIFLSEGVCIGRSSIIAAKGRTARIYLEAACNVGSNCRIATEGKLRIGESSLIAAYAYIGPGNHEIESTDIPIVEQGMKEARGVSIGANTWIGARATIMDGVSIGDNAIIGAHALVREDIPANAIAAGIPAKVLRYRK